MEVGLIIAMFALNVFGLDCLYNQRIKTTGAVLVLNLCLVVALAYQFQQVTKIMYLLLALAIMVLVILGVRFYLHKRKQTPKITDVDHIIEEKEVK